MKARRLDAFGVGTQLSTSADAPSLSAVYKLVELRHHGHIHYTAKYSDDKSTLPAAKQIYRYPDHDTVTLHSECNKDYRGEPLLRPVIMDGELIEALPPLARSREHARQAIAALPKALHSLSPSVPYEVEISPSLLALAESRRQELQLSRE